MIHSFTIGKFALFVFLVLAGPALLAQNGQISGKVVDEAGNPLVGATVSIQRTALRTSVDEDGNYVLRNVPTGRHIVTASFVGHFPSEKNVSVGADAQTVDFALSSNAEEIGEVVVIGYGAVERKHLTGSVSTVQDKDFQKGAVTSPDRLIQGKVAGVSITSNGGAPGAGSTIRVRGGASLSASNNPLIVVDGNPLAGDGIAGSPDPLALINPSDIESVTVLKDANATAIYGSRASNGVLLITTKTGRIGRPRLAISSVNSLSTTISHVDVLSADQMRDFVNANGTQAKKDLIGSADTDWQGQIYQDAFASDNNITLSGGLANMPYRVSAGMLEQAGVLKTDYMKRWTAGINLSPRLFDRHLKVDLNLKGTITNNDFANTAAIGSAIGFDPTQPVRDENSPFGGYFEWMQGSLPHPLAHRNPVSLLENYDNKGIAKRSFGNLQADYSLHFLPELHVNANLGYDVSRGRGSIDVPDFAASDYNNKGFFQRYRGNQDNFFSEFYLNYAKDIASIRSNVNLTAGYGYYDNKNTQFNFSSYNAEGTELSAPTFPDNVEQNRLMSYYGRLIYSLADRYVLSGTIRADGSSKFSPDGRWGVFPSVALTWRLKEEDFLRENAAISDLKIRASYGQTGNKDGIANYGYIPSYHYSVNESQYQIGNRFYHVYSPLAYDRDLRWESTATTNIGLDYGLWGGRIHGSVDVYQKKTKDLLATVEIPVGTNFSNQLLTNVGNMENQGIELSVNLQAVRSADFGLDFGLNITVNKSKLTNLTLNDSPGYQLGAGGISGGTGTVLQYHTVGLAPFPFYVYKQVYDAAGKPLEGVYEDLNGDGIINFADRYYYKKPAPDAFLGFTAAASYKKWTLNTVLRANFGNYAYDNVSSDFAIIDNALNANAFNNNTPTDIYASGFKTWQLYSDYYVSNASFLKMDNIGLTYDVGNLNRKGTVTLTVSANCQNVFTVTQWKGIDPEISNGIDFTLYPRPRTYSLGLNFGF